MLHSIEIATRNAMHYTLAANYGVPDWYDRAPLSPHWRGKVNEAKTASGVRATPGKVIAELTFGFWVDLVKHNNHRVLWVGKKLNKAFPNASGALTEIFTID